jgi:hypothetical protein
MRSLKVNIHHHLSKEEAVSRIKKLFTNLRHEQKEKISNVKEEWKDGTGTIHFTAQGFDLSAIIAVHRSSVDIDAKVPFAIYLFKGKIKEVIKTKAEELLSHEK